LRGSRPDQRAKGGTRLIELVLNGRPVASQEVPADGAVHELVFSVAIDSSSWVALRHFPQLHTNPVSILVADQPIRGSRNSARWCIETIKQLWQARSKTIAAAERDEAKEAFEQAIEVFARIAAES
jgi:hypothetical protein